MLGRSQQAVDATIVSPVTRAGDAQPGADVHPGRAVDSAARRKRRQTYPELERARRRLVVVGSHAREQVRSRRLRCGGR